jgi:hypothetical protein
MTARSTYEAVAATAHTAAEFGGVTPNTGATVAPVGNATTWSRSSAKSALASGSLTQAQFISVMNFLANYEQEQVSAAKSVLRNTGDLAPA